MSSITLKREDFCNAELYVAKKELTKKPILSWNRVYDYQDEISYVIEFDGTEYVNNIYFNNKKANWQIPFDLERRKIYKWRVKAYDGYEYSDYSKFQYIQLVDYDIRSLLSFIDVKTDNVKNGNETLSCELNITKTIFNADLMSCVVVERVKKVLPCEIEVNIPNDLFLSSSIEIKKRNYDFISSEIFIKTKNLLPPKGPLGIDMQSEIDYTTGNQSPTFSWWKSLDELFNDGIEYEIEVSKNPFFTDNLIFFQKNIKNPISNQMVYPLPIRLEKGIYYWRVRSTDNINYSNWVYGSQFTIDYTIEELNAEIFVTNNFTRESLLSEIVVKPKEFLLSEIEVWGIGNDLLPSITQVWAKKSEKLDAEIFIYFGPEIQFLESEIYIYNSKLASEIEVFPVGTHLRYVLDAEIEIKQAYLQYARLNVIPKSLSTLNCEMKVLLRKDVILPSTINIFNQKTNSIVEAFINVTKPSYYKESSVLMAEMEIKKTVWTYCEFDLSAKIILPIHIKLQDEIMSELNVLKRNYYNLECEVDIKSRKLYPVKIYSEQDSTHWNNNNRIEFSWEPHQENHFLVGYIMQFNNIPDYIPELGLDYYEHKNGEKTFLAKVFDVSGEYYFHIIGFDDKYRKTPVSHYKILYNNKPEAPKHLMINGIEFSEEKKVVCKNEENTFSWEQSYDKDENDFEKVKYELMICNKSNFEYPDYTSELLEDNFLKISFKNNNFYGEYYWRVRGFDGKEYGEWSKISSFIINNPPSTPTDIEFFGK